MLKILFLHATIPNYVADGLFHGLRSLDDAMVVDIPRHDVMYLNASSEMLSKTGSKGGCIYGKLELESIAIASSRVFWQGEIDTYDVVIISDPHNSYLYLDVLVRSLGKKWKQRIIWIDGSDSVSAFPFTSKASLYSFWHKAFIPILKCKYYKREFLSWCALLGIDRGNRFSLLHKFWGARRCIRTISIVIPDDFIRSIDFTTKSNKWFPISPDNDLAELLPDVKAMHLGQSEFIISNYDEYENYLNLSRFGIVCKRRGWDSLRVYEYAARGVIICFRNLHMKPPECAPFGLNESNSISYSDGIDLQKKLDAISIEDLVVIQKNAYNWISKYTTISAAKKIINNL